MAVVIQSGASADKLTIDSVNNAARVTLYDAAGVAVAVTDKSVIGASQSGIPLMGVDNGTARLLRTDSFGTLRTGEETLLFYDPIEGAAANTNLWVQSVSTMTIVQANGVNVFNSGASTSNGVYAIQTSARQFPKYLRQPLMAVFRVKMEWYANAVMEFGFGAPTTTTAKIADGAWLRKKADGTFVACTNFNSGTENVSSNLTVPNLTDYYTCTILIEEDTVRFVVEDSGGTPIVDAQLAIGVTTPNITSVSHLPLFVRVYTSGVPGIAPKISLAGAELLSLDMATNKPWAHQMAGAGKNALASPLTPFAQLTNWTNSAAPTTRTITNTTALETTLGGQFAFNSAGTSFAGAETDLAMFTHTVAPPYTFVCTGVRISAISLGAASGATIYTLQWGLSFGAPAVTIAAGTFRVTLGFMSLPATAAIGTSFDREINVKFDTPFIVDAGAGTRILHVIVKVVNGTGTLNQVIRGVVQLEGYYE